MFFKLQCFWADLFNQNTSLNGMLLFSSFWCAKVRSKKLLLFLISLMKGYIFPVRLTFLGGNTKIYPFRKEIVNWNPGIYILSYIRTLWNGEDSQPNFKIVYQPDRFQQLLFFHLYHDWVSLEKWSGINFWKEFETTIKIMN